MDFLFIKQRTTENPQVYSEKDYRGKKIKKTLLSTQWGERIKVRGGSF
jgi:hypothetical protein